MIYFTGRPGEIVWIYNGNDTQIARIEASGSGKFKVRGWNSRAQAWYPSTKWVAEDDVINNIVRDASRLARQLITNGKSLPLV